MPGGRLFCNSCQNFTGGNECSVGRAAISCGEILMVEGCPTFVQRFVSQAEQEPIEKAKKINKYISKDGFELVALRRGFTEIIPLWGILQEVIHSTKSDCFICGGYARYCASPKYNPTFASDIDIYSQSDSAYRKLVELLGKRGLLRKTENSMAISYQHPTKGQFHYMPPLQVIKSVKQGRVVSIGDKETIISNFDFTIIRAAIESPDKVLVDADFTHDESRNILRLKNIHHPLSSLLRCAKYISQKYWLTPVEAAKLFKDWDGLKDEYKSELLSYINEIEKGVVFDKEHISAFYDLFRGRVI